MSIGEFAKEIENMEDRYLCKAKRKDNGEWVIGFYAYINKKHYIYTGQLIRSGLYDIAERFEVDPSTICRCTGSIDKSGNLIWEHDIAKAKYSDGFEEITEVAYSKNGYSPYLNEYECEGCCCRCEVTEIEVIGNIFDNPELLESEG